MKVRNVVFSYGRPVYTNYFSGQKLHVVVKTLAKEKKECCGCFFNRLTQCGCDCGQGKHWHKVVDGDILTSKDGTRMVVSVKDGVATFSKEE